MSAVAVTAPGELPTQGGAPTRERIGPAILAPVLCGLLVGMVVPDGDGTAASRISLVLGWVAFFAWSVSFYTQIVLNFQRRSVIGVSPDFWLLNVVGFGCYFAFNAALFGAPLVREEYWEKHRHDSAVRLSDVLFAGNALVTSAFVLFQIWCFYDYQPLDKADWLVRVVIGSGVGILGVVATVVSVMIWCTSESALTWLAFLQYLAQVKVVISVVKYCPQVWMNFKRKSTEGWSMGNVFLDFIGGWLTVAQLLLDSWMADDWSAITGDLPKLLLGNVSMFFDVVFFVQHYCLYPSHAVGSGSTFDGADCSAGASCDQMSDCATTIPSDVSMTDSMPSENDDASSRV